MAQSQVTGITVDIWGRGDDVWAAVDSLDSSPQNIHHSQTDTRPRDDVPVPLPEMLFFSCLILMQTFKTECRCPLLCEALPDFPKQNEGHHQHFEKTPLHDTCHLTFELFAYLCISAVCKQLNNETDLFIHVSHHSA